MSAAAERRVNSTEFRTHFADHLREVDQGGTVVIEHYRREIARLVPPGTAVVGRAAQHVNSTEFRTRHAELLREVDQGGTIVIEHYRREVAHLVPPNTKTASVKD